MATTLTIRNINPDTKQKIRLLAARNGHSMEEEVRRILNRAVNQGKTIGLGSHISQLFKEVNGVELEIPARSLTRPAPSLFDETE